MYGMSDTIRVHTSVLTAEMARNDLVHFFAVSLKTFGWTALSMGGNGDATYRRYLHDAAKLIGVQVHTFKGGPYNATMYAHVTDPEHLCCYYTLDGDESCRLPVTPWIVKNDEWVRADIPPDLR